MSNSYVIVLCRLKKGGGLTDIDLMTSVMSSRSKLFWSFSWFTTYCMHIRS